MSTDRTAAPMASIAIGLSVVLALMCAVLLAVLDVRESAERGWVDHTYEVMHKLREVELALTKVEASHRGYLLAGDEASLSPWREAEDRIDDHLDSLKLLTGDNAVQAERVTNLTSTTTQMMAELHAVADAFASVERPQTFTVGLGGQSAELMTNLRGIIAEMDAHEFGLLEVRRNKAAGTRQLIQTDSA